MEEPTVAQKRPVVLELEPGTYWWCRCGRSKTQPWCDRSHVGTAFQPLAVTISEKRKAALCQCKHTNHPPMCDGSHARL